MEALTNSTSVITAKHISSSKLLKSKTQLLRIPNSILQFPISTNKNNLFNLPSSSYSSPLTHCVSPATSSTATWTSSSSEKRHWIVLMEAPPKQSLGSREKVIDYYVKTLETLLGSEKEAQMSIYNASLETHFGFCCDIDEHSSLQLSRLPGVLSVRLDPDFQSETKNYDPTSVEPRYKSSLESGPRFLFPLGTTKHWLVRMDKPRIGVVSKAQMVDHYAQTLAKALGNEKDAQMCIYHVSWQSNFGFCCELDENCARQLAGVPGVLRVQPDENFESEDKDYGGSDVQSSIDSSGANEAPVKTKKLFVTGLSFYTSEKTLRAAFEGFGELVEVRIIMDQISKRSKGYAFIEYTTVEAASEALKEMNGKIINGWMIVVDAAKPKRNPPRNMSARAR